MLRYALMFRASGPLDRGFEYMLIDRDRNAQFGMPFVPRDLRTPALRSREAEDMEEHFWRGVKAGSPGTYLEAVALGWVATCEKCRRIVSEVCGDGFCRRCHISLSFDECMSGAWIERQRRAAGLPTKFFVVSDRDLVMAYDPGYGPDCGAESVCLREGDGSIKVLSVRKLPPRR